MGTLCLHSSLYFFVEQPVAELAVECRREGSWVLPTPAMVPLAQAKGHLLCSWLNNSGSFSASGPSLAALLAINPRKHLVSSLVGCN